MTFSKFTKFALFSILLLAANTLTFAQNKVCVVSTYLVDLDAKASTSRFVLGTFDLRLDEDDYEITKFYSDKEAGINISVGVQIFPSSFKPNIIKLVLSFTGKPDDTFELLDGSEAETIYDKNWKLVSVSDNIKVENRIYTYTLSCERERKKLGR